MKPTNDLVEISLKAGVPTELEGCHTMFVAGYVVEGLVPVEIVRELLAEKPAIAGSRCRACSWARPACRGRRPVRLDPLWRRIAGGCHLNSHRGAHELTDTRPTIRTVTKAARDRDEDD
jgi:hypothetical protein